MVGTRSPEVRIQTALTVFGGRAEACRESAVQEAEMAAFIQEKIRLREIKTCKC